MGVPPGGDPLSLVNLLGVFWDPSHRMWTDALRPRVIHRARALEWSTYTGRTWVVSHQRSIGATLRKPPRVEFLWFNSKASSLIPGSEPLDIPRIPS